MVAHRVSDVCASQGSSRACSRAGISQADSGRLQELLRRNDGSSESVARTGVLEGGTGQDNVVVLYVPLRLRLLGKACRARYRCLRTVLKRLKQLRS